MVAEFIAGALLSPALGVLFDRLASREVLNFFRGRSSSVEAKLKELRRKLHVFDAVLDDAEANYFKKEAVKKWLDALKDAIYDAEDLVDEIDYQLHYQSRPNQVTGPVSTSTISFDIRLESKLEDIIHRLEGFAEDINFLGLRESRDVRKSLANDRETSSLLPAPSVIGRDSEKEDIINLLLSNDAFGNEIGVIPIVGMGGMGKTTLAQIVYNDARVGDQHFEIRAWVSVSDVSGDVFDIPRISQLILAGVAGISCEIVALHQIQLKLQDKLRGKKYLIVMDDVWNENYANWEKLMRPLIAGARGSKIIATTRSQKVAFILQQNRAVHQNLGALSDEVCFSLFSEIAFRHPNREMMRRAVVERCQGLPLAAKTLGGLLRFESDIEEWKHILESDLWDLPKDETDILPVLYLSYYYLPRQLKQCFAYCSVFPKGCKLDKERLILIWMAQGFVKPTPNETMEKIGERYYDELVSRSLFHKIERTSYFTMHDLVHDLARVICGPFSICVDDEKKLHDIPKEVRHISFVANSSRMVPINCVESLNEVKSLRTLLTFWKYRPPTKRMHILPPLHYLRVLSLGYLPFSIDRLTNLRFLELSYVGVQESLESIGNLYNLQTLIIGTDSCLAAYPRRPAHLPTLPSEIGKLVNLRHLDMNGADATEMPKQVSSLTGLQQLSHYVLGKNGGLDFEGLKGLRHLRGSLCISNLQNVTRTEDALVAKLKERVLLKILQFEWYGEPNESSFERELLENLQPHTNLTSLTIRGYKGTVFPDWLGDLSYANLVMLNLWDCEYCFHLPALGQLPSLQKLWISGMGKLVEVGSEFYGDVSLSKPFQHLRKLTFSQMDEWKKWDMVGYVEFSQLQVLNIWNCPKLTGTLPTRFPVLKKFAISSCPNLVHFPPSQFYLNLQELWISNCALESVSVSDEDELQSLDHLNFKDCPNMVSIAQGGLSAPNLRVLTVLSCTQLTSLPERMCSLLPSLSRLHITGCPELELFPDGGLPSNLRTLVIGKCKKLVARRREWGIQTLSSLESFDISKEEGLESFPDEGLLPSTLTRLYIHSLPNLKLLNNRGLQLLGSLEKLHIENCPQLHSLPKEDLPNTTHKRWIDNCPLLESQR